MKTPAQIIDGFPEYLREMHKGRKKTTIRDIRKRQMMWLRIHLVAAHDEGYREGYNDCDKHYQGKR